jgi:DNA-directed RNA polymerase subunit RPC12/RpoP
MKGQVFMRQKNKPKCLCKIGQLKREYELFKMKFPKPELVCMEEERYYRYVCPNCLRTFIDNKRDEELFCWKCGEKLKVIP